MTVEKEETGDVYVFVILNVCARKISIRDASARGYECVSHTLLARQERAGNNVTRGKRRYMKEDP